MPARTWATAQRQHTPAQCGRVHHSIMLVSPCLQAIWLNQDLSALGDAGCQPLEIISTPHAGCSLGVSPWPGMIPPWMTGERSARYARVAEGQGGAMGHGSFGRVYFAVDRLTNEVVAVKRQGVPGQAAGRELATLLMLRSYPSPNIVQTLEYFGESGTGQGGQVAPGCQPTQHLYVVLELADSTVWHLWKTPLVQRGLLPRPRAAQLLGDLCRGVDHLHKLGIVHGDLSFKNLLILQLGH
jgi:hypothetical protein